MVQNSAEPTANQLPKASLIVTKLLKEYMFSFPLPEGGKEEIAFSNKATKIVQLYESNFFV